MPITGQQWTHIYRRIMSLQGMDRDHDSGFIAEYGSGLMTNGVYIKFMSDGGSTDDANGTVLSGYMRGKGYDVLRLSERSLAIRTVDLVTEFTKKS